MAITKIIITSGNPEIGVNATEQDHAEWREAAEWCEAAEQALAKAYPNAEIEIGRTDSMNSALRLESDDEDEEVGRDSIAYQEAMQILERMW